MRLSDYRIEAGHYVIGEYTILWGGNRFWQVRIDDGEYMIGYFPTLRECIQYCQAK
jgi:hypothetical protein